MRSFTPSTNKVVVEGGADQRTRDGDETPGPLLYDFGAGLRRDTLNNVWDHAVDHILFEQVTAEVHSGGAGGSDPKLGDFLICVVFKPVDQAQLLNLSKRDPSENAEIGENGDEASQAEPRPVDCRQLHSSMNNFLSNRIERLRLNGVHAMKAAHRQTVRRT